MNLKKLKEKTQNDTLTDDLIIEKVIKSVIGLDPKKLYTTSAMDIISDMPYGDFCIDRIYKRLGICSDDTYTAGQLMVNFRALIMEYTAEFYPKSIYYDKYTDLCMYLCRIYMK